MIVVCHDLFLNVVLLKVECFVLKRERMMMKEKRKTREEIQRTI